MITVTFEPNVRLDPEALREAVRRADFTPTEVRAWVTGTLEPWQPGSEAPAELGTLALALVDGDTGQRFLLTPGTGDASLDASRAESLTVWGVVETMTGVRRWCSTSRVWSAHPNPTSHLC